MTTPYIQSPVIRPLIKPIGRGYAGHPDPRCSRISRTQAVPSRGVDADVGDEITESRSVMELFQYCETIPTLADQRLPRDLVPRRCGLKERNPLFW